MNELFIFLLTVLIGLNAFLLYFLFNKNKESQNKSGDLQQIRQDVQENRKDLLTLFASQRQELSGQLSDFTKLVAQNAQEGKHSTKDFFDLFEKNTRQAIEQLIGNQKEKLQTLEQKQTALVDKTSQELEQIRSLLFDRLEKINQIVAEKLENTLDKRIGESFAQVSERLEQVHQGLGQMQTLAQGVGDLKKMIWSTKEKGIFGEWQLEAILGQILTVDQYEKNVQVNKHTRTYVDFAIKIPNKFNQTFTWIPIDAKFPTNDFEQLLAAYETGEKNNIESCKTNLRRSVLEMAKQIASKYICPPETTDFAMMFVPSESLYAEILRIEGLMQQLQSLRITLASPSTLAAMLNSLQMGFRTLAIEQKSVQVWQLLAKVRKDFSAFLLTVEKIEKSLHQAQSHTQKIQDQSKKLFHKLTDVEKIAPSDVGNQLSEEEV